MAEYSLYNTYVVQWLKALASLDAILTKAEAHAKENGIDANATFIGARLYDDMLPLTFQIQFVTSQASMVPGLLTGNAPKWADDEKTFADLHTRIKTTQDYINSVKPGEIDGRDKQILKTAGTMLATYYPNGIAARDTCEGIVTPNVYFHLATAYAILRNKGVPLNKFDYMLPFMPAAI